MLRGEREDGGQQVYWVVVWSSGPTNSCGLAGSYVDRAPQAITSTVRYKSPLWVNNKIVNGSQRLQANITSLDTIYIKAEEEKENYATLASTVEFSGGPLGPPSALCLTAQVPRQSLGNRGPVL